MNRITSLCSVATVAVFLRQPLAHGEVLVGSSGCGWQEFPTELNNYSKVNRPFWDNPSRDAAKPSQGGPLNIGNFLTSPYRVKNDSKNPDISIGLVSPQWWGSNGSHDSNFDRGMHFNRGDSVGSITAQLLLQASDNKKKDIVGWYNADNPSEMHEIWNGQNADGREVTFTPSENWGFYMITPKGVYYMDASFNTIDVDHQHFAIFMDPNSVPGGEIYYVGVEDMPAGTQPPEDIGDFNDFVFKFWSTVGGGGLPVPEPASLMIIAAGTIGLLVRRRK